ncbi:hypothetical protein E2C01_087395 [Portunus trituberculatus]|uniref:Uncharacterized protein n=1 Tax=Portunus trituberculatus TaxID=210409 RepID=A0A5B7JD81_PORTR|nr:hypothetical protein [Portunus trituberculatus]
MPILTAVVYTICRCLALNSTHSRLSYTILPPPPRSRRGSRRAALSPPTKSLPSLYVKFMKDNNFYLQQQLYHGLAGSCLGDNLKAWGLGDSKDLQKLM